MSIEHVEAFKQRQARELMEITRRHRKDAAREAVVSSLQTWLRSFFDQFPDLAPRFPDDAARRRLAEAVADLVLSGGA